MSNQTLINLNELLNRRVTKDMLNRVTYNQIDYDTPTILDGKVVLNWYYSDTQPSMFSTRRICISAGRKTLTWLICGEGEEPGQSWIYDQLAKWIISEAHNNDNVLKGFNDIMKHMYRKLGADIRGSEAVALLEGPLGVMIYKAPKWRSSNFDCGPVVHIGAVQATLEEIVPATILFHAVNQVRAYYETWLEIYGTHPEITVFHRTKPAGTQVFVTIGNDQGAATIQFNQCEAIECNTLIPSVYIKSILKDFK